MDALPYVFVAVAGLLSGLVSGMSGGGGGMLMLPVFIIAGLPPQQAVATGKMNGLGAALGGLSVFAKTGYIRKDILKIMIPIAVTVGIVTPFVFAAIDSQVFQVILGVLLLVMAPTLFIKKRALRPPTKKRKFAGYSAYSVVLTIQALFGGGVGSLALFVLTLLLGTSKLEANATKRAVTAVLTPLTFVALLISGYVNLAFGLVGMVTVFMGTHIGSKIAINQGERFVSVVMAGMVTVAGVVLIVNALTPG